MTDHELPPTLEQRCIEIAETTRQLSADVLTDIGGGRYDMFTEADRNRLLDSIEYLGDVLATVSVRAGRRQAIDPGARCPCCWQVVQPYDLDVEDDQ